MRKVIEYYIARADGGQGLINEVNILISLGWQPKGRPIMFKIMFGFICFYYQAMVKYEEE